MIRRENAVIGDNRTTTRVFPGKSFLLYGYSLDILPIRKLRNANYYYYYYYYYYYRSDFSRVLKFNDVVPFFLGLRLVTRSLGAKCAEYRTWHEASRNNDNDNDFNLFPLRTYDIRSVYETENLGLWKWGNLSAKKRRNVPSTTFHRHIYS